MLGNTSWGAREMGLEAQGEGAVCNFKQQGENGFSEQETTQQGLNGVRLGLRVP